MGDIPTVGEISKQVTGVKGLNFAVAQDISATTGTVKNDTSFLELDGSSNTVAATLAAPRKGQYVIVTCTDGSNDCTLTLTAGTFDGSNNIATFNATSETLVLFGLSATRFVIIENIGSVALS